MPRRRISYDVAINVPSAQREADRLANIFQSRLRNVQVGTVAGRGAGGAGGGGGGGGSTSGTPGSSLNNLIFGSLQYSIAGHFYQFFSQLPQMVVEADKLATANRRASASFVTLAGGAEEANAMIDAYIRGTGNVATRVQATTEAMRLYNIGMAQTAQQMQQFTTLSRGMSTALGRDVQYVQEQFSLALANQSQLRFDQLGLSIERHKTLMDELLKQNPEMSREIAFQNAMLQQATERYYELARAEESLATTTEVLGRVWGDTWTQIGQWASQNILQQLAEPLARLFGATDYNLPVPRLQARAEYYRNQSEMIQEGGNWLTVPGDIARALSAVVNGRMYEEQKAVELDQYNSTATLYEALAASLNSMQAAANNGIKVTDEWVAVTEQAGVALRERSPEMDMWAQRLVTLKNEIDAAIDPTSELGRAIGDASAEIETLANRLAGLGVSLVGKLVEAGASDTTVTDLLPSQDEIERAAMELQKSAAMQGDIISDELAKVRAEQSLFGEAEAWIDAANESERAQRRAASEMEQAAKNSEKAFVSAADSIYGAYEDMLNKIPGLFTTSQVTEEDMTLAKLGFGVNYADDALRRLEDVAFNKKDRSDVDLGAWARALGQPEGTDPQALAILGRRAWETGSLWSNPQNIGQFLNIDAARADLRTQEQAALGQQNLKAFFGLDTPEGNEFLRVFGMEALDPIQSGLITEITTRGPIMGETLASAIHDGFSKRSLQLPWVQTIMGAIDSAVGRALIGQLNAESSNELSYAESLPTD